VLFEVIYDGQFMEGFFMKNMSIQFVTYSAFTEATRQVKEVSKDLQKSFDQQRQQTQAKKTPRRTDQGGSMLSAVRHE